MTLKKLLPLIGIVIFIIVFFTIDIQRIFQVFTSINPVFSALAFLSIIPIILFSTYEWQMILKKQKIHVTWWYSLKNLFIGYFYGFITPGGFGAYTRALYLRDESGEPVQKCLTNIILFNTIDYISLLSRLFSNTLKRVILTIIDFLFSWYIWEVNISLGNPCYTTAFSRCFTLSLTTFLIVYTPFEIYWSFRDLWFDRWKKIFLKDLVITFRRDPQTKRPRVNKEDSKLDRQQKKIGEYYYIT